MARAFGIARIIGLVLLGLAASSGIGWSDTAPARPFWGLNFGPYIGQDRGEDPRVPPPDGEPRIPLPLLTERLDAIAPYTKWVRSYACDVDLQPLGRLAHARGLKMAMGAWIESPVGVTDPDQLAEINAANHAQLDCLIAEIQAGHVDMAIIGSEVLLRLSRRQGEMASILVGMMDEVRAATGSSVPVTTADTWHTLISYPTLIENSDLVMANIFPFWEEVPVDQAIAQLDANYLKLKHAAGCKPVYISETGWPSRGAAYGAAIPSDTNATRYLLEVGAWAQLRNVPVFYFETFDEWWKNNEGNGRGPSWGVWDGDLNLKPGRERFLAGEVPVISVTSANHPWTGSTDFFDLPDRIVTNLDAYPIAVESKPDCQVRVNGEEVPETAYYEDDPTAFALVEPLDIGDNPIRIVRTDNDGRAIDDKTVVVHRDSEVDFGQRRILYVSVNEASDRYAPFLEGTVVIDLDRRIPVGFMSQRHVMDTNADGSRAYLKDGSVIDSGSNENLFSLDIRGEISRDYFTFSGAAQQLYASYQRFSEGGTEILPNLPDRLYMRAAGTPAFSDDGRFAYYFVNYVGHRCLSRMDMVTLAIYRSESICPFSDWWDRYYTDALLSPDGSKLLLLSYAGATSKLENVDPETLEVVSTLRSYDPGYGDTRCYSYGNQPECLSDYSGRLRLLGSRHAILGFDGNPSIIRSSDSPRAGIAVVDLDGFDVVDDARFLMGAELDVTQEREIAVSYGKYRFGGGVRFFALNNAGMLSPLGAIFLGVHSHRRTADQFGRDSEIDAIVFKPSRAQNPMIPPQVHAGGDIAAPEGGAISVSGAFLDPDDSSPHAFSWDFGDGHRLTGGAEGTHRYADSGVYTVSLTVTDGDGAAGTDTLIANIRNIAPTVAAGADQSVGEGDAVVFNGAFTDPGVGDTHSHQWDFGDGTTATDTLDPTHAYADNGSYTVTLTVTDDDGGVGTDTLTVNVANTAPSANAGTDQTAAEGAAVQFAGTLSDPGTADTHSYLWDFGDGSTASGSSVAHSYADNGSYTVRLTVTDDDGASDTDALTVTINNVAPTADAGNDRTSDEGAPVQFAGTHTDRGSADTHEYLWDLGDGNTATGASPTHAYADNGTYNVMLTVTDDDGGSDTDGLRVMVNNVAPTASAGNNQTVDPGDNVQFAGSHRDPGTADTHRYDWDFGDDTGAPDAGPTPTHVYAAAGSYRVMLTVTDDDGASGIDSLRVDVGDVICEDCLPRRGGWRSLLPMP